MKEAIHDLVELLSIDQLKDISEEIEVSHSTSHMRTVRVVALSIKEGLKTASAYLNIPIEQLEYRVLNIDKSNSIKLFNKRHSFGKKVYNLLIYKNEDLSIKAQFENLRFSNKMKHANHSTISADSHFFIQVRKSGVMLRIFPYTQQGKPVELEQILNILKMKNIVKYDLTKIKSALKNMTGKWVKIGPYVQSKYDSTFNVTTSSDKLRADIYITAPKKNGRIPELKEILEGLRNKQITYGVDRTIIQKTLSNEVFDRKITIAKGKAPTDGKDAQVKKTFKQYQQPQSENDIWHVHKGDIILEKIPLKRGENGMSIFHEVIKAKEGKDIKLIGGTNTKVSDDGTKLIAEETGHLTLHNGLYQVNPILEIKEDVGPATGNITFPGSVLIHGNVLDTYTIECGGNLEIRGNIENCTIKVEGSLVVTGIQGRDKAFIFVQGNIHANFIERTKIDCYGNIYAHDSIIHSYIRCMGSIFAHGGKHSQIVGGSIATTYNIFAKNIGGEAYTETDIRIGEDPFTIEKLTLSRRKIKDLDKKAQVLRDQLAPLYNMKQEHKENFPALLENKLQTYEKAVVSLQNTIKKLTNDCLEMSQYLHELGNNSELGAQRFIYPGVHLTIKKIPFDVKKKIEDSVLLLSDKQVTVKPFVEPQNW